MAVEDAVARRLAELDRDETAPTPGAPRPTTCWANSIHVELRAVLQRRDRPEIARMADRLLAAYGIEIEFFDAEQARVAAQAYRDYGSGSGHRARLNLGDSYSYALAHIAGEPLLFLGDDFIHTDIPSALS